MTPDGTWQNDREAHLSIAEPTMRALRTSAVRSSATEFDIRVDEAAFDAWLNKIADDSFKRGYALARQVQGKPSQNGTES